MHLRNLGLAVLGFGLVEASAASAQVNDHQPAPPPLQPAELYDPPDCNRPPSPEEVVSLRRDRDKTAAVKAVKAAQIDKIKAAIGEAEEWQKKLASKRDYDRGNVARYRDYVAGAKSQADITEYSDTLKQFKARLAAVELELADTQIELGKLGLDLKVAEAEQAANDKELGRLDADLKAAADCPPKKPQKVSLKKTKPVRKRSGKPSPSSSSHPKAACVSRGGMSGAIENVACQDSH
jgi:hypothetical protein